MGADLTRLSCDEVLVPTDRSLEIAPSWRGLFADNVVGEETEEGFRLRGVDWSGERRVAEVPGEGRRRIWLVDSVEEYLHFGDARAALAGVLHFLLLTRHVLFVGTSMLDDDLIRIAHEVRRALQVETGGTRRRTGTVLALREDPARARLWAQDVDTVAMSPAGTPAAEAARRMEVVLDLISCVSTPPDGYLLDPAYRGLLTEDERRLADALVEVSGALPGPEKSTWASEEVELLLRRLGLEGRS